MSALLVAAWLASVPVPDELAARQERPPTREEIRRRLEQAVQQARTPLQALTAEGVRSWLEADQPPAVFPLPANPAAATALRNHLEYHQKQISLLQYKLSVVLDELKGMNDDVAKEPKHWQAVYHYVAAHLELRIAQLYEQNAMMGEMRKEMPACPPNQTLWRLVPSGQEFKDREAARSARQARQQMEKILQLQIGGGWERVAREELKSCFTSFRWEAGRE